MLIFVQDECFQEKNIALSQKNIQLIKPHYILLVMYCGILRANIEKTLKKYEEYLGKRII